MSKKLSKKLCGFLFWKNYQVVFLIGMNEMSSLFWVPTINYFSLGIFQQFLSSKPIWPCKMALPNCRCIIESWQILCRYVYVFRKLNSINPINHNLSFCGSKSSSPFVKLIIHLKIPRLTSKNLEFTSFMGA